MFYFLLAVVFTVLLYVLMRAFPKVGVDAFQAIIFNYYACVGTGLVLTPGWRRRLGEVDWHAPGIWYTLALGALFVLVFLLIGQTTRTAGITAASVAGNMSLVIPVVFGLFVLKNTHKEFTAANYTGLCLALAALVTGAWKSDPSPGKRGTGSAFFIWPFLYFLVSGTNNTLINYLSSTYFKPGDNTLFMIIACMGAVVIGTVLLGGMLVKAGGRISYRSVLGGLLLGIPNFLSLYFLLKALAAFGNSAAFVFPVYNILTMLVSALAAWLIYREKLSPVNRVGLLMAVVAILLISYQELGWG